MKPIRFAMMVQLCILLFGAPNLAHAEDLGLCVAPVFNDPEQMFDVEVPQPSRLVGAHATNVLTEYPGLILHPKNRDGIYTVTNGEYKKVPDNIASQIGRWGAGKKRVKTPFNAVDLPKGFTHNDMRSEFYPELGLFLTRNANSIWYRKPDQDVLQRYVKAGLWSGFNKREMGGSWGKPEVWRNATTGMVVMAFNARLLLVGSQAKVGADINYEYHALRADRFIDPIFHETSENLLFWRDDRKLYQLTLEGVRQVKVPWSTPPLPKDEVKSEYRWNPRFSQTDPKTGDVLFRHFTGMARYDGHRVTDIKHWNTTSGSKYTSIVWLGNTRYASNSDGLFQLDDELRMSLLSTPFATAKDENGDTYIPAFTHSYSEELDRIFVTDARSSRVFTTVDFLEFHEVQNAARSPITGFVSDIPNESAVLFVGRDGLYQVASCAP